MVFGRCSATMGFPDKHASAELVINADQATGHGNASTAWVIQCFLRVPFFLRALNADGATNFFIILQGKITEFVPMEMSELDIADRRSANRHTIRSNQSVRSDRVLGHSKTKANPVIHTRFAIVLPFATRWSRPPRIFTH
jgi:hypothetical protein